MLKNRLEKPAAKGKAMLIGLALLGSVLTGCAKSSIAEKPIVPNYSDEFWLCMIDATEQKQWTWCVDEALIDWQVMVEPEQ
ncbi:MAG: hypothetical protein Alpg2KO_18470 [Alphaproteobacteria bacterium]